MPIKDKSKYPKDWANLSKFIRFERAQNKCEFCKIENYSVGWRNSKGVFFDKGSPDYGRQKLIKIVLTVAHLDHDTTNNDHSNLAALCQRCHLGHDLELHKANAAKTRADKADLSQSKLF
jgi:hypothetical protein